MYFSYLPHKSDFTLFHLVASRNYLYENLHINLNNDYSGKQINYHMKESLA